MSQTHRAPITVSPNPGLPTRAYPSLLSVELFPCTKGLRTNGLVQKGNSITYQQKHGHLGKKNVIFSSPALHCSF